MQVVIDPEQWKEGYQHGAAGMPRDPGGSDSYYGGWIEGNAARHAYGNKKRAAQLRREVGEGGVKSPPSSLVDPET